MTAPGGGLTDFDLVVLGGGPGGYASALYAASTGLSVAMVEKEKVGGTCLHRGCIPAKALLHAAEVFRTVSHAGEHGVKVGGHAGARLARGEQAQGGHRQPAAPGPRRACSSGARSPSSRASAR